MSSRRHHPAADSASSRAPTGGRRVHFQGRVFAHGLFFGDLADSILVLAPGTSLRLRVAYVGDSFAKICRRQPDRLRGRAGWLRLASSGQNVAVALEKGTCRAGFEYPFLVQGSSIVHCLRVRSLPSMPGAFALELQDSSHRRLLEAIAADFPTPLTLYDSQMRLQWINAAARRQFSVDHDAMLGRSVYELVPESIGRKSLHERAMQGVACNVLAAPATPPGSADPQYFDMYFQGIRGTAGIIDHMLVFAIDVTARVRAERAVRQRQDMFRVISNTAQDIVLLVDPEGRVEYVNPAIFSVLGYAPEMRIGQRVFQHVHPDDAGRIYATLQGIQTPESRIGRSAMLEVRVRHADGRYRWLSVSLINLMPHPAVGKVVVQCRDVTERRALETQLLDIVQREQAQLGADLHDGLGQELTGASLLLQALVQSVRRGEPPSEQQLGEVARIISGAIETTRHVARGLAPVGLERDGFETGIRAMAQRAASMFGVEVHVRRRGSAALRPAEREAYHLYRICQESLTNAARHGNATRITVTLRSDADRMGVAVADNGKGFDVRQNSSGVGLKILRYRSQLIGAVLSIKTRPGAGARIVCSLQVRPGSR